MTYLPGPESKFKTLNLVGRLKYKLQKSSTRMASLEYYTIVRCCLPLFCQHCIPLGMQFCVKSLKWSLDTLATTRKQPSDSQNVSLATIGFVLHTADALSYRFKIWWAEICLLHIMAHGWNSFRQFWLRLLH